MFLLPQGYEAELVAVFEPSQILSGLAAQEVGYPEGTPMLLRVNLQTAPADPNTLITALNQASTLTPWSVPTVSYDATENAIYVNYVRSSGDIQALQTIMSTQQWQLLLILAGALFLIGPVSDLISQIVSVIMMFFMMYMMSGMMRTMQPGNKPAEQIYQGSSKIIQGAKKYLKLAVQKGKEYANRMDPEGKADLENLAHQAKYGVDWAKSAISGLWSGNTGSIIEDAEEDIL